MKTVKFVLLTAALGLFMGKTIYAQGNEQSAAKSPAQSSSANRGLSEMPGAYHPVVQPVKPAAKVVSPPVKQIHSGSGNAHAHTPKPAQPNEARYETCACYQIIRAGLK